MNQNEVSLKNSKQSFSENSKNLFNEINYDFLNQSLLTVENVQNILYTISPELSKLCYVTFDYPNFEELLNHKYSIINIKQFFSSNSMNYISKNIDEDEYIKIDNNLNDDLKDYSIGYFIIIINNHPTVEDKLLQSDTCIIYPLYYINCFNLENYLKNDCGFKNVVWNYNIIQHGNSSSCGWECCKIAYDYFVKNNIEVECKDYKLIDV